MAHNSSDPTSINDIEGDQNHATVKSILAMAPDEFFDTTEGTTLEEAREFAMNMDKDRDRQEAKRDGAVVANYYFGRLQMQELEEHLRIEFPHTWETKFRVTENFTKSISRQLSTIYKKAAAREAVPIRNANVSDTELESQTELIEFVYKRGGIDRAYQEVERFAKWAKSVLIQVKFASATKKIILKPWAPQFYDVKVSPGGAVQAVIISDYLNDEEHHSKDTHSSRRWWIWTDTQIAQYKGPDMQLVGEVMDNPLERVPFVFFNDDLPIENEKPYLHADTMLSNANLAINRLLTDAMSYVKNETYGQPYVAGGDANNLPQVSGHEVIWHIPADKDTGNIPTVGILSPNGDFDAIMKMIERAANGYGTSRGLAPDSFTATKTGNAQSGVSLKIKNHVLLDMRDGEEEKYQGLENEMFSLVRDVHNLHSDAVGGHELPEIREDVKLSVHFDENSLAFESPIEVRRQMMSEVNADLLKPTDFIRHSRPHLSEDEAKQYIIDVKKEKVDVGGIGTLGSIDSTLGNTGHDDEETSHEDDN